MSRQATGQGDAEERALQGLFRAIGAGDRAGSRRLLKAAPGLAQCAAKGGATRQESGRFFFAKIGHGVYQGDTALHLAAAAYDCELARALLGKGASVRAKNRRGAEPLHYACDGIPGSPGFSAREQSAMVGLLLEAGAVPDALDKSGVAPLHRAVRTRSTPAVVALLKGGTNPRLRNKSGSTPLHLAIQGTGRGGSGQVAARKEQAAIIRVLLDHGARLTDKDTAGKSVRACITSDWVVALLEQV